MRAPIARRGFFGQRSQAGRKRGRLRIEIKSYNSAELFPATPNGMATPNQFLLGFTNDVDATNVRCIFSPQVGSGIGQRVGRQVYVTAIQCRGWVKPTQANGQVFPDFLRFMVVLDMQPNAAPVNPAVGEIIGTGTGGVLSSLSFNNLDNRARFKTLMDWKMATQCTLQDGTGISLAAGAENLIIDWYKRFKFPVTFNNGSNGSIDDITTGKILVFTIGQAAAGTGRWNSVLMTRVRYMDP